MGFLADGTGVVVVEEDVIVGLMVVVAGGMGLAQA